jgi:hypothetical protein
VIQHQQGFSRREQIDQVLEVTLTAYKLGLHAADQGEVCWSDSIVTV